MPHATMSAASGVIGDELFVAGGYIHNAEDMEDVAVYDLQIYDFTARTWHLGAALPYQSDFVKGVVADGKLFVISTVLDSSKDLLVYDPQSNSWTEEAPPPTVTNPDDRHGDVWITVNSACAHKNRLVVFLSSGRAFERANDGSWSPLEFAAALSDDDLVESVILG